MPLPSPIRQRPNHRRTRPLPPLAPLLLALATLEWAGGGTAGAAPAPASPPAGAAPAPADPEAGVNAGMDWRGWEGLHYQGAARHGRDWKWTDDERQPMFPSLFLDRLTLAGKFGARLDLDAAVFAPADGFGAAANGVQVRRWRLYTSGDAITLMPFSYTLSIVAVANNQFVLDDTYLDFKRIPQLGNFRIGAFTPRMGLENSASSRDAPFMEWSSAVQALGPRISLGGQFSRPVFENRGTWNLGVFTQSLGTDVGDATKNFVRIIGRATGLPWYEADPASGAKRLLHLGLNANYLHSGSATIQYETRPESHLAPFMVDTGRVPAEGMASFGLEAAWVDGPWSVQGEYLENRVTNVGRGDFRGFYVLGSHFFTGESRNYDPTLGYFNRLKPRRDFDLGSGGGAVEGALRFSWVDLDSGGVAGGLLRTLTAGLNWYLHANSKLRFNYVFANGRGGVRPGDLNIFETRFEFDF